MAAQKRTKEKPTTTSKRQAGRSVKEPSPAKRGSTIRTGRKRASDRQAATKVADAGELPPDLRELADAVDPDTPSDAIRPLKPKGTRGRPARILTPAERKEFLGYLEDGVPLKFASHLLGIHESVTNRNIVSDDEFAVAVRKSVARFVANTIGDLRSLPAGQWQRAAWMLERLFPEFFSSHQRQTVETTATLQVTTGVCRQLSDSWQAFQRTVVDVETVTGGNKPSDGANSAVLTGSEPADPLRDSDPPPGAEFKGVGEGG